MAPTPAASATEYSWITIALMPAAGPGTSEAVAAGRARRGHDGPAGGEVDILEARTGRLLFTLRGSPRGPAFGWSLAATPSPGKGLLLVGSPSPWGPTGMVHVFSCRDGSEIGVLGEPEDAHGFGDSVAWIGDIDGDGTADIAVGAPGAALPGGGDHAGAVLAYSGATLKPLWQARGAARRERFGVFLRGCPDLDGDGVAAQGGGWEGIKKMGLGQTQTVATVLSGATGRKLWRAERESTDDFSPVRMEVCRDRDGDGVADLLAHRRKDPGHGETGRVLEVLSGATGALLPPDDDFPYTCADGEEILLLGDRDGDGLPERVRRDNHVVPGCFPHSRATYLPSRNPSAAVSLCAEGIDTLHGLPFQVSAGREKEGGIATLSRDGDLLVLLSVQDGRVLWIRQAGEGPGEKSPVPAEPADLPVLRGLLAEIEKDLVDVDGALSDGQGDRAREAGKRAEGGLQRAATLAEAILARMREEGSHPWTEEVFAREQANLVRLHDCWIRVREELR